MTVSGCLVWDYSFDTFSFPKGIGAVISVLRLGAESQQKLVLPLTMDTMYNTAVYNLKRGKGPFYCPEDAEEAVVATCQPLLLPKLTSSRNTLLQHARPEEQALNWAYGGSPTLICKDSLLFDETVHSSPDTITVTYANSYEAFG